MGNFIQQDAFSKYYYSNQDFSIINIGYHDFSVVKAATEFRTQAFYTWHFVLSGSGTLEIYGKQYHLKGGDMFFIPPDTPMRYYPHKNDPWEYVWFSFKGNLIEMYSRLVGFSARNPVCEYPHFETVKRSLKSLFDLLIHNKSGYFGVISTFYKIMDISTANSELTEIQQVKSLLDENFADPNFSVEQLCRDIGISHAHLLRLFKDAYGMTLIKYVTQKRMELACELLRTTNLLVRSVACSCGFADEIHFMKTFKKTMGISALQYKHQQK